MAFLCLWIFWHHQDLSKMALWLQSLKGLEDHVKVWAGWWAGPRNLGHLMSISTNLLMWWNFDHVAEWKFKTFPLFHKAIPIHLKTPITWHPWHFCAYESFGTTRISAKWRFGFRAWRAWRTMSKFELGGGRVLGIWAMWWAFPPICSCDEILITLQNENSKHSHCLIKQFRYT